jgi:hypothetical protein
MAHPGLLNSSEFIVVSTEGDDFEGRFAEDLLLVEAGVQNDRVVGMCFLHALPVLPVGQCGPGKGLHLKLRQVTLLFCIGAAAGSQLELIEELKLGIQYPHDC